MSRPASNEPALRALARASAGLAGWVLFTLGLLLVARSVYADGPQVAELEYNRPAALAACPDGAAFRRAVSERLRRDPFVLGAARKIRVSLARSGATLTALVHVEERGRSRGDRRIDTRADCAALASGAALAVSIAIDPAVLLGLPDESASAQVDTTSAQVKAEPEVKPEPSPRTKPEPSPPPLAGKVTAPSAAASQPAKAVERRVFARVGLRVWAGIVPEISVGPSLGAGYQSGHWSLALDAIAVLPRTESVPETRRAVAVDLLGAELAPCAHFAGLRGCALFASGALLARGEGVDQARTGSSLYAATGLGVGYSLFVGRFSLTPSLEGSARLATTELSLDNHAVWTSPRWVGSLGLELGYDLWR
jgi:hypothetical protein